MTIICANLKEMSADTMVSGGSVVYYTTKIFRIRDSLVGVAGSVENTTKFLAWFRKECPADEVGMTLDDDHDFAGLVLNSKGLLYYADCVEPDLLHDKFSAIGAGAAYAATAMSLGKNTSDAAKIAIERDPAHCGGKVMTLHLLPAERKGRKMKAPVQVNAPIEPPKKERNADTDTQ